MYTVREAAEQLNMTPEGERVARRHKRLRGFKINEKCWGFHQSELDRYKNCYKRLCSSKPSPSITFATCRAR